MGVIPPPQIKPSPQQAQDPDSQSFEQMMQSLGRQPIRTSAELGTNLLADALDRYGDLQKQKAAQAAAAAQQAAYPTDEASFLANNGWS